MQCLITLHIRIHVSGYLKGLISLLPHVNCLWKCMQWLLDLQTILKFPFQHAIEFFKHLHSSQYLFFLKENSHAHNWWLQSHETPLADIKTPSTKLDISASSLAWNPHRSSYSVSHSIWSIELGPISFSLTSLWFFLTMNTEQKEYVSVSRANPFFFFFPFWFFWATPGGYQRSFFVGHWRIK